MAQPNDVEAATPPVRTTPTEREELTRRGSSRKLKYLDHLKLFSESLTEDEKDLFLEVRDGDTERAKAILKDLKRNIDLEKRDFYGRTILAHAVTRKNEELVDFMIGDDFPSERGMVFVGDSLNYAVDGRHYEIVEKLLKYAKKKGWIEKPGDGKVWKCFPFSDVKNDAEVAAKDTPVVDFPRFMKKESFGKDNREKVSVKFSDDLLRNPIIGASIVDDYPIIHLLYGWGFRAVMDENFMDMVDGAPVEKPRVKLNRYRAACSPSYLSVNEDDAIEVCFAKSRELEGLAEHTNAYNEHIDAYNELAKKVRQYAVSLLDQCRDHKEALSIMSKENENVHVSESSGLVEQIKYKYPRLEWAIECEQKEFVAHPHCQKVLNDLWNPSGGRSFNDLILTMFLQAILSPIITLYLWIVVSKEWSLRKKYRDQNKDDLILTKGVLFRINQKYLTSPKSACLRYYGMYIIFCILLICEVLKPQYFGKKNMTVYGCPLDRSEVIILIFVLGHVLHILQLIYVEKGGIFNAENFIYIFSTSCFFLSYVVWGFGHLTHTPDYAAKNLTCETSSDILPRYLWDKDQHFIYASEVFFMLATIFAILKILEACKINKYLGMMQHILVKTVIDSVFIVIMALLLGLCFSFGLYMMYYNYKDDNWDVKVNGLTGLPRCRIMNGSYSNYGKTIMMLIWSLFGFGDENETKIFQPNIKYENGTLLDPSMMDKMKKKFCEKRLTRDTWENLSKTYNLSKEFEENEPHGTYFFGTFTDILYNVLIVVLVLNLLIARMSQTYAELIQNADVEWRFQRAKFLMRFMDYTAYITPPFNMLGSLHLIIEYARKFDRCLRRWSDPDDDEVPRKLHEPAQCGECREYHKFEDILHQRLLAKNQEEISESAEVLELSKELVQDTNEIMAIVRGTRKRS